MKKIAHTESHRVLARILSDELSKEALESVSGGCTGPTCTDPNGETDRGPIAISPSSFGSR